MMRSVGHFLDEVELTLFHHCYFLVFFFFFFSSFDSVYPIFLPSLWPCRYLPCVPPCLPLLLYPLPSFPEATSSVVFFPACPSPVTTALCRPARQLCKTCVTRLPHTAARLNVWKNRVVSSFSLASMSAPQTPHREDPREYPDQPLGIPNRSPTGRATTVASRAGPTAPHPHTSAAQDAWPPKRRSPYPPEAQVEPPIQGQSTASASHHDENPSRPNKRRHLAESTALCSQVIPHTHNTPEGNPIHAFPAPNFTSNTSFFIDDDNSLPLPSPSASPIHTNNTDIDHANGDANTAAETSRLHPNLTCQTPDVEQNVLSTTPTDTDYPSSKIAANTEYDKFSVLSSLVSNLGNASPQVNALMLQLLKKSDRKTMSYLYSLLGNTLKKDLISTLPAEISWRILQALSSKDLLNCLLVSKNWSRIFNGYPELWKNLLLKENLIKEEEYNAEYQFAKSTRPDIPEYLIPRLLYQRRHIIQQRWMDTKFQPKHTVLTGDSLNVITCLQFDDDKIAASSNANQILIYETRSGKLLHTFHGHTGGVWAMKFYGNILASGSTDRTVRIWNIKKGVCTHIFRGHTSTVRCLDIIEPKQIGTDSEGKPIIYPQFPLLVTGSRDATLYVWKLPLEDGDTLPTSPIDLDASNNPNLLTILKGHKASVRAVMGYGNILISGSYDCTARVWDLMTGECKWVLDGHTDKIYACVYDVKRNRCYTSSVDNTVRIWDLNTGETIAILEGHQILVGLVTYSENILVSAAADSTVRIWDPDTGQAQNVFRGHSSAITCVENDDYKVLSGSQGMLKLWDAKTGNFVRDMASNVDGAVWQVAIDYRRCIAAVQRNETTYIEVTDFAPPENDPLQEIVLKSHL